MASARIFHYFSYLDDTRARARATRVCSKVMRACANIFVGYFTLDERKTDLIPAAMRLSQWCDICRGLLYSTSGIRYIYTIRGGVDFSRVGMMIVVSDLDFLIADDDGVSLWVTRVYKSLGVITARS